VARHGHVGLVDAAARLGVERSCTAVGAPRLAAEQATGVDAGAFTQEEAEYGVSQAGL
jgi:hypothetical protein